MNIEDLDTEVLLLKPKNVKVLEQAISAHHTPLNTVIEVTASNKAELARLAGVDPMASFEELYAALQQRFSVFSAWPEDAENLPQPEYEEEELAVPA